MRAGGIAMLTLVAVSLSAGQVPAPKSPNRVEPRKYVQFDFDGNPEQALEQFFRAIDGQQPDFLRNLIRDQVEAYKGKSSAELRRMLEKQTADNPFIRGLVEEMLKQQPDLIDSPQGLGEALKKFQEKIADNPNFGDPILKDIAKKIEPSDVPQPIPNSTPPKPNDDPIAAPQPPPTGNDGDFNMEEKFAQWLTERLKDEEVGNWLAEMLHDAPELREAVGDLVKSLQNNLADNSWMPNLPKSGFDWTPPNMPFELGNLPKLSLPSLPELPRFNLPLPRLGKFSLPGLPSFDFGGGNMPSSPSLSGGSEWLYAAGAILLVLGAWWLARHLPAAKSTHVAAWVRQLPATIATRADLRKAFEVLALGRLGETARPWNHRQVARNLGDVPENTVAADQLAQLYEEARYTPGDEAIPLALADRERIRECLALLSGGSA